MKWGRNGLLKCLKTCIYTYLSLDKPGWGTGSLIPVSRVDLTDPQEKRFIPGGYWITNEKWQIIVYPELSK